MATEMESSEFETFDEELHRDDGFETSAHLRRMATEMGF